MKLYYAPGACSLVPHIIIKATNQAVELVKVSKYKTPDGGDYFQINPKGSVPVLQLDDGSVLTEGPVIVQYLADRAGDVSLMPAAGSMARYRVMEWQNYITSELHKGFSPMFNPAADDATKAYHHATLLKKFAWVDQQLAGKTWLTGDTFTAADAYLFVVSGWARYVNMDTQQFANLTAFQQRAAALPAVQAAMKEEGLLG